MSTQTDIYNAQTLPDVTGSAGSLAAGSAAVPARAPKYHFFLDLFRGFFLGAYAVDEMRTPGILVWIIVGFIPVLGTLSALRDAYYSVEVHEWGGLVFNLVGLLPFMKGFANIVEVSHLRQLKHMAHATHQVLHAVQQERKIRKVSRGSRKLANVVTGAAHDAGAVSILTAPRPLPGRNKAALPALLLALITALILPIVMLAVVDVIAGAAYFRYSIPLAFALGSGVVAMAASVGVAILAHHARSTAKLLRGRPFSRGFLSGLAVGFSWIGMLVSVAIMATIIYVERNALPHL